MFNIDLHILAGRILVYMIHHKKRNFIQIIEYLVSKKIVDEKYLNIVNINKTKILKEIDYQRDFNVNYF